jgi:hypothetical protein
MTQQQQPWGSYLADASAEAQREGQRLRALAAKASQPGRAVSLSRSSAKNPENLSAEALAFLALADKVFNPRRAEVEAAIARAKREEERLSAREVAATVGGKGPGLEAVTVRAEIDALERILRRLRLAHERVTTLVKAAEELVDQFSAEDWMD